MLKFALIAIGGAVGSVLRYLLHNSVQRWVDTTWPLSSGAAFPFGTLAVNVLGCLAIGVLAGLFAGPWPLREEYRRPRRIHDLFDVRHRCIWTNQRRARAPGDRLHAGELLVGLRGRARRLSHRDAGG